MSIVNEIDEVPGEVRRGRGGRPYIMQPDGTEVTYTRISTLAKTFNSAFGLDNWRTRMVALGLACRPDLVALVASHHDDAAKLAEAFEMAMVAAQSNAAANYGTAVHKFTEQVDTGTNLWAVPDNLAGDLEAYRQLMADWTVLDTERFIVVDELKAAGTYDKRMIREFYEGDGLPVIADVKTGRVDELAVAMQMACYAHGEHYSPTTGLREPFPCSRHVGALIHVPLGQGVATLYAVNLTAGWAAAIAATTGRNIGASDLITEVATVKVEPAAPGEDPVMLALADAVTVTELRQVYASAVADGRSPDDLLPICIARKAELEAASS